MHLRSVGSVQNGNIVAELRDPDDVELANDGAGDDFIVSQRLISLLLAQLSESPRLRGIFADLFDADGAGITKHPAERYVPMGATTFGAVVAEARNWGVIAIGYQSVDWVDGVDGVDGPVAAGKLSPGLRLNPAKDESVTFGPGDQIIVISRTG
jgi:hypothetical protein